MQFISLFSGIGGIDLGLERAGMQCVAQVEIDDYCQRVLAKHWPDVSKFRDVRMVGSHNLPHADLICGGFPCQDISYAGPGAGLNGKRSGLWFEFARIVSEIRPRYVLVENVAALLTRGFGDVLGTLAALGYDAEWAMLRASDFGLPHRRERLFIVAYTHSKRLETHPNDALLRFQTLNTWQRRYNGASISTPILPIPSHGDTLPREPAGLGSGDGISSRLGQIGRIKGCGNAVAPQIAEYIGRCIQEHAHHE